MITVVTGCGRLEFDSRRDASVGDASPGDAAADAIALCDPFAPFTSVRELVELSTPVVDGGMRLTDDELVGYFHRSGGLETLTTTRTSRELPFSPPTTLMASQSFWPTVSSDGLSLVYNLGSGDIYSTTRISTSDSFPAGTLVAAIDVIDTQGAPHLGRSDTTLYFTRYIGGGGTLEVAPWPQLTSVTQIAELEDPAAVDQGPTPSADERVMYFSRDGEVMVAARTDVASPFGVPVAVATVNLPASSETPTWLSVDQCRLYFESDRAGNFDIYLAERTP